jgi:hypothetical protein
VTFGDFVFEKFSFTSTGISASDIEVIDLGNGIGFSGDFSTGEGMLYAGTIGYTVNSIDPIKDVAMSFSTGEEVLWEGGDSVALATLTLTPTGGNPLNEGLSVMSGANDWDGMVLDPELESIAVKNSITAIAGRESGASVQFVGNYFSTEDPRIAQPPTIPEPASLVLLPLALAGLSIRKKFIR